MNEGTLILLVALAGLCGCFATGPGRPAPRRDITVAGRAVPIDAPVIRWDDPGGFDGYAERCRFREGAGPRDTPERLRRYGRREGVENLADLRSRVTQIVVHYDAAGNSRRCFEILHDLRGLSCHFLVDLDGTVYQTLDVIERAWHAGEANDRSVGIEIANLGAYQDRQELESLRERFGPTPEPIRGRVQGSVLHQPPFTDEQYRSTGRLVGALARALEVPSEIPRRPDGRVRSTTLPGDADRRSFRGIVGHLHLSANKVDPGPAFDWERLLRDIR